MNRDVKGRKIRPGDIVSVKCIVTGLDPKVDYYNVVLETTEPCHPLCSKVPIVLNCAQVELLDAIGESNVEMDVQSAIDDIRYKSGDSRHDIPSQ